MEKIFVKTQTINTFADNKKVLRPYTMLIAISNPKAMMQTMHILKNIKGADQANTLVSFFDDVETPYEGGRLLSENQAVEIAAFVKDNESRGKHHVMITSPGANCRARAIACAIDAHYNGRRYAIDKWLRSKHTLVNAYVLRLMLDAFAEYTPSHIIWEAAIDLNREIFEKNLDQGLGQMI